MDKDELIGEIKKINNIFKYSIKGGTSMFNKEHPDLLSLINKMSIEMQKYSHNKKLVAKLLYLKEFNGNISNITENGIIMIYDPPKKCFRLPNPNLKSNACNIDWSTYANDLKNISESNTYSKNETINLFGVDYEKYFGKSGNRKLIMFDVKLYNSLYYHTTYMNKLNNNLNKFSMRLYILTNNINIHCEKHKKLKHWTFRNNEFIIRCGECEPKYPSVEWFKKKYGNEWERYLAIRRKSVTENKTNSLKWHIKKYGNVLGQKKYSKYVTNKMKVLSELKANKYSKISQDLFWKIYNKLDNNDGVYFHDLNQEYVMRIPDKYQHKNTVMMFDFKQNMKIIEYNGNYWHSKPDDEIRYSILRDIGYDVLIINSDEYNRNRKPQNIIKKCVKFLSC